MGITLRMVSNLITKVGPLTDTALGIPAPRITAVGITRTCTIGIVSPFMDAAISAVSPVKHHPGLDLISDALPFGRLWYDTPQPSLTSSLHFAQSANQC